MGLLEGYSHRYILYAEDGEKAYQVIPLGDDVNNLGSLCGRRFTKKQAFNLSDDELGRFKELHNLKRDYELNDQMDIFDVI